MWAFVLYDPRKDQLFLSRDRLGIKPLYFFSESGVFAFASEIAPLLELADLKPIILRYRLANAVVYGAIDAHEQTIYKDVFQLRGGHSAVLDLADHNWNCWRYWNLPRDAVRSLSDKEVLDEYSYLLEDSVKIRLRADVPLAITLSGGVDSSAVALAVSRVGRKDVPAYTSHFSEYPKIDETEYAVEVARMCGLETRSIEPDVSRLLQDESKLCAHQELPFGSLSLYIHWTIIEKIKQQRIKVVFSGQGGDELFLGYECYFAAKVLSSLPNIAGAFRDFINCARKSRLGISGMAAYQAYFTVDSVQAFYRRARLKSGINASILSCASTQERKVPANLQDLQEKELLGEQLSHLLRYDDRTVSAHGMETRLPFLDYRLVEFAYRLPWKFKIRDGWSKWLSRAYLDQHGLDSIAWRRQKLSFNAPTAHWVHLLWRKNGQKLIDSDRKKRLLAKKFNPDKLSDSCLWDVYNLLELSNVMGWAEIV